MVKNLRTILSVQKKGVGKIIINRSIFFLLLMTNNYSYASQSSINWATLKKVFSSNSKSECEDIDESNCEIGRANKREPSSLAGSFDNNKIYCLQLYSGGNRKLAFEIYEKYKEIYPDLELLFAGNSYYVRRLKCIVKLELLYEYMEVRKIFANIIVRECSL